MNITQMPGSGPSSPIDTLWALRDKWNSYEQEAFTDMVKFQMDMISREIEDFFNQNPDIKHDLLKTGTISGLENVGFKTFRGKIFKGREEVSRKPFPPINPTRYDIQEKDLWEDVIMFPGKY